MSYILEALRRAEREREGGRSAGIESLSDAVELARSHAPLRIWALGLATLFVAFAALLVALLRQPAPIIITVPTPAPVSVSVPAAANATVPAAANAVTVVTPSSASGFDSVTSDETASSTEPGDFDDTGSPMAEPEPSDTGSTRTHRKADKPRVRAKATTRTAAPAAADSTADNGAASAVPAARLQDMPEAYRAQFPSTTLDVHVYDSDASRRWIMVDGKRYREGETLANGAHIHAIGADSVTYDYNGAEVAVPVR